MASSSRAERGLSLAAAAAAAAAAYALAVRPLFLRPYALALAGMLLMTAGLLIASDSGLMHLGLLACAAADLAALWRARSRAAFAALIAGGLFWALKRQSGRRRWLMTLGAALFAAGAVHGSGLGRWKLLIALWLARPALACELAVLIVCEAAWRRGSSAPGRRLRPRRRRWARSAPPRGRSSCRACASSMRPSS